DRITVAGSSEWRIPEAQEARLELRGALGTLLSLQTLDISPLGTVEGAFDLPEGLPPGLYSMVLDWGSSSRGVELEVVSGAPPELSGRWELPTRILPNHPASGRLWVSRRPGLPLPGAAVRWHAIWRQAQSDGPDGAAILAPGVEVASGTQVSGGGGSVAVGVGPLQGEGLLSMEATIVDAEGRSITASGSVNVRGDEPRLRLVADHRIVRPGKAPALSIDVTDVHGQPWRGKVDIRVRTVRTGTSGEALKSEASRFERQTDAKGHASIQLASGGPGYVDVEATIAGEDGRGASAARAETSVFVTESGGDIPTTPERLVLILDRSPGMAGEEARFLVLCPFESGLALVGSSAGGPPELVVPIRGYSGLGRIRLGELPAVLSASALSGGRVYRARVDVASSSRGVPLSIRVVADPASAGVRGGVALEVRDSEGHGVPAWLSLFVSSTPLKAPMLSRLLSPPLVPPEIVASGLPEVASGAGEATRPIQPFGPSGLSQAPIEEARETEVSSTSANDLGDAVMTFRPRTAGIFQASVWAVEGPGLWAEHRFQLEASPGMEATIDAPAWVRSGDRFEAAVRGDRRCPAEPIVRGGRILETHCEEQGRIATIEAGTEGPLELGRGGSHSHFQQVEVRMESSSRELSDARIVGRRLAGSILESNVVSPDADLSCAKVRALGALSAGERPSRAVIAALAALAGIENGSGGFGPPTDGPARELRRDCAALAGMVELSKTAGTVVDRGLLDRTRSRVVELASDREARDSEEIPEPCQPFLTHLPARRRRAARATLLAGLEGPVRLGDPLGSAEAVVALEAVGGGLAAGWGLPETSVERTRLRIEQGSWTLAAVVADDEPPTPKLGRATALHVGDEVEVSLSARVPAGVLHACVRDFPPAGLLPMGIAEAAASEVTLCGETSAGHLSLGYKARAIRAGSFAAPEPSVGFAEAAGSGDRMEILHP
ncbi:MAG: hypothetical protein ACYCWW_01415, partial [Deltaproteobacteria bacterium]